MTKYHRSLGLGRLAAVSVFSVLILASAAFASGPQAMTQDQIAQKVLDQGYTKVIRMEMEDGMYEVKATDKEGKRVKLNVDPKSGNVVGIHKDSMFGN
jgi:hypothetical protein